nr:MAG TPA: hypothetical protein [Caudoviricetes sp.]
MGTDYRPPVTHHGQAGGFVLTSGANRWCYD